MKKHLFILLFSIIILHLWFGFPPVPNTGTATMRIIAHRGNSTEFPENTLPAFAAAIQSKADGIELDIRQSLDGVPIVFHDADLKRLAGKNLMVDKLTSRQLLSQTVGNTYPTATICSLEHVLLLCQTSPCIRLHIELKTSGTEEKVVSLLQKHDFGYSYEISSADATILQNIKKLSPQTSTFLILSSPDDVWEYTLHDADYIDGISVKSVLITSFLTSLARYRGHEIYAWTVNDCREIRRVCRLGVDGVITDQPTRSREFIESIHSP